MIETLLAHKNEFARAISGHKYEVSPNGLYFPGAKLVIGGAFSHRTDGGALNIDDNVFVAEGLEDLLNVYFAGGAQQTAFYIAPYSNNVVPTGTLTGATFTSTQGEFTNYDEPSRQLWEPGSVTDQSIGNTATTARFTASTGGGTVRGAALLTSQPKSSTSGECVACAPFSNPESLNAGSKLDIEYTLRAEDQSA